jgi:glycosyltransferase involved in cell wall biosynthesis
MDVAEHVLSQEMITGPKRVLLLNGVVRSADAISRSLLLKRDALHCAFGCGVRIDVAAHAIDDGIPNAHCVQGIVELMCLEAFQRADLLIYEFGVFYDLFGSVRFAPPHARKIAVWHNVTPPDLAPTSYGRTMMERSLAQISNMLYCDQVLCVSEFNAAELTNLGFDNGRIRVLNLPVSSRLLRLGAKPRRADSQHLRLLYVGRFVPSKGVLDLVRAAADALRRVPCDIELSLVGNIGFSEPRYLKLLDEQIAASQVGIRFCGTLGEDDLVTAFHEADILVMPSYHEGYCLPVIEAFAAGCHVISYDTGNLPSIVGSYGALVPCGDVLALTDALADCFTEHLAARRQHREPAFKTGYGAIPESKRRYYVRHYASRYSEAVYAEGFLAELSNVCSREPLRTGVHA